jgi:hypothetical protein
LFRQKNIFLFTVVHLIFWQNSKAQFFNLPNDYFFSLSTEKELAKKDTCIHSGIQPYIQFFSKIYKPLVSKDSSNNDKNERLLARILFKEDLISIKPKGENFSLKIDPLFNFELGKDFSDKSGRKLYNNTRGFIASGYVGDRFYFETFLAENQSVFPNYINSSVNKALVVPGQGRWKSFKTGGYDYAFSSGFISMQPLKNLNIQVGHGKQKIGNGYRSLLLSDNAFNYPFIRFTQQWLKGRIQYNNIYAVLMNLDAAAQIQNPNSERLFQKKAASFQYLSVNPNKSLNFGFFQGMIWQAGDTRNQQHLDWQYFNPVIYTNLMSYGLNNKNNILIGGDIKFKVTKSFNFYAQIMADNLNNSGNNGNGWGFQGGFHYFDVFGVNNLFLQSEVNYASDASYLNPLGSVSNQSFSQYNQNLASIPLGGRELVVIGDYKLKRFFMNFKYNYQINRNNQITEQYNTTLCNAKIGYLVNPAYNFNISVGINYRTQNFYTFNVAKQQTTYIYVGVKTSLYNLYYDF